VRPVKYQISAYEAKHYNCVEGFKPWQFQKIDYRREIEWPCFRDWMAEAKAVSSSILNANTQLENV
jgi:hypothetical protein